MMLDLDMPHTVHVIVAKDLRGFKRGFEKMVSARVWFSYSEAIDELRRMGPHAATFYAIEEAVIGYPTNNQGGT